MAHYYTNDETRDEPSQFTFELNGKNYVLDSNSGVFSRDKLDQGTRILLETVLNQQAKCGPVLDMGCGIGPVSKVIATEWNVPVTAIDVNEKAVALTKKNTAGLPVTALVQDHVDDARYPLILINPPIRTGKETMYGIIADCVDHLTDDGVLWIVIRKQHGAQSLVKHLEDKGCAVERAARSTGYWILKVRK